MRHTEFLFHPAVTQAMDMQKVNIIFTFIKQPKKDLLDMNSLLLELRADTMSSRVAS